MNIILVLIVWLSVAIVVGISFGKFCAAGSGRDAKIPRKMSMESETSANNVRRLEAS